MRKVASFFFEILQTIVFAISIFLFIYLLVLQPHRIKGSSMEPNFHDGEYLLTDKISYRFNEPKKGDVVVFKAPPTYEDEFIKRIIGVPGDRVVVTSNGVFINDLPLIESYLPTSIRTLPGRFAKEAETLVVPEGQYFVMGDNREHSQDSRNIGFIPKDKITGRAWVVYWPVSEAGIIKAPSY
jgi:signal peptidase I